VLHLRNYELLRRVGPIVYLRAPAEVLRARVGRGAGRPLLRKPGAFDRLLAQRSAAYEAAADVIVDVDGDSPDEVADRIVKALL
jgi:shikimate kinase